ncbi:hypothetical protein [Aneurinibacillus migulanus]|uniref:hypothetical protein n=1 Tax=Aneurinibacillus migulanus TaxID=47500 RepID=UPI001F22EC58|nr:hypothetical protein [Aneurinibacillus migulanus]
MIHQQIFMVRGKRRRKGGGRERSENDTLAFLLPDRRAHPISSFFRISYFQPRSPVKILSVIYIVPFRRVAFTIYSKASGENMNRKLYRL